MLGKQIEFERRDVGDWIEYEVKFKEGRWRSRTVRFALAEALVEDAYARSPNLKAAAGASKEHAEWLWAEANRGLKERSDALFGDYQQMVNAKAAQISKGLGGEGALKVNWDAGRFTMQTVPPEGLYTKEDVARIEAALQAGLNELSAYAKSLRTQQEAAMNQDLQQTETGLASDTAAASARLLADGLLREIDDNGKVGVDYAAAMRGSMESLRPLAQGIVDVAPSDVRGRLSTALTFFQSMPYDPLKAREMGPDMGFLLPAASVDLNRGDCDTKSVALAAVLKWILPQNEVVMIVIDGHALLGIAMEPLRGELALTYDNRKFVLLEPAGPAVHPIGEVSPVSDKELNAGRIREIVRF